MSVNSHFKITRQRNSSQNPSEDFWVWSTRLQQEEACAAVSAAPCYALNFMFVLRCEFTDNYPCFFCLTLFLPATWLRKIILRVWQASTYYNLINTDINHWGKKTKVRHISWNDVSNAEQTEHSPNGQQPAVPSCYWEMMWHNGSHVFTELLSWVTSATEINSHTLNTYLLL